MRRSSFVSAITAVVLAGAVAPGIAAAYGVDAGQPHASAVAHRPTGQVHHEAHGRYTVRFTDASGHPLAGVIASAERNDATNDEAEPTATSNRNGRASLTLRPGRYLVFADGSRASGGTSDSTGYVGTERGVTVRVGRTSSSGTVVLASGGAVQVHVVDTQGHPVAGVHPDLVPVSTYVQPDQGGDGFGVLYLYETSSDAPRTDADGAVTLTGVPLSYADQVCVNPGDSLFPTDSGFLSACTSSSILARAAQTVTAPTIVVQRRTGVTLTGRLRNRAGHGFDRSTMEILRGKRLVASVQTAAKGRFRVAGLTNGSYRVCATDGPFLRVGRSGYQPGCAAHRVTLAATTGTASVSVVLPVGAAASGTVTGPHGAPVGGAYVDLARNPSGSVYAGTDRRGRFLLKGLPAGHNSVCVRPEGATVTKALPFGVRGDCKHTRRRFTARIGRVTTGIDLSLPVGAAASGTVVDGRGRPVPYADIEADAAGKGFFDDSGFTSAGARGHFTLRGLASGRYRLCADVDPGLGSGGYGGLSGSEVEACHHGRVTVRAGHLLRHIRIVLPTTAAVRVTAVDEHGRGVAGVDATVIAACHRECATGTPLLSRKHTSVVSTAITGSHGAVLLDGLRPGHYAVCLFGYYGATRAGAPPTGYADQCAGRDFDIVMRAGHIARKRVVLHAGGAVSGRITDANGDPLAGVLVHVAGSAADDLPQSDLDFADLLDEGGPSALPGYYSVTAADGSYTVRSVRPGDRLVCADPTGVSGGSSHGGYLPQCVGGTVGSTSEGAPVTVRGGEATGEVDLALASAGAVSGRVTSKVPHAYSTVLLLRSGTTVDFAQPSSSGTYRFAGLAPGTYAVCVDSESESGRTERGRCYDNVAWNSRSEPPPSDATPVQVLAGAASTGIDVVVPR